MSGKENDKLNLIIEMRETYCFGSTQGCVENSYIFY